MLLPNGKLPPARLRGLLASLVSSDASVIVGPQLGEDAAILDLGGPELVAAKTDPITFATEDIGRYLLAVNSNDLATMGAEPRWLLVTALLPEGSDHQQVEDIFHSVRTACDEAGVTLVGGHTEITVGLDRPILAGFLLGTVGRGRIVRTAGAKVGDALVLAGGIAIEGTAILAREHSQELLARGVDQAVIETAAAWLCEPGISILPMARALNATCVAHAMHDPTEGGLVTALHELAEAARVGLRIDRAAISVLPVCRVICEALELDPLGLLASGALLAALDPVEVPAAVGRLRALGIAAVSIGEMVPAARGRTLTEGGRSAPLPVFERDELARYLERAPGSKNRARPSLKPER
jgi:hydrogenase maturation factor